LALSRKAPTEKGNFMVKQLIVPVDDSSDSWRAFDVALRLAARADSSVSVVHVASDPLDGRAAKTRLQLELNKRETFDVEVDLDVRLSAGSVASELETLLLVNPGAVIVMASHGKGRSAAVVGSTTEDMLQRTFGPLVLVGPHVEPGDFSGPIIVTVDGSDESEAALPLAAAWGIELRATPWILNVSTPVAAETPSRIDTVESAYPSRLAKELRSSSGHPVEFDELHGRHPDQDVPDYATRHEASLIIASSHGRSGLSRVLMGSVTAGFVRNATCPVVVIRLPHPQISPEASQAEKRERMWAY